MGLAVAWSATQLLGPTLPIRIHMSTSTRLALVPVLGASLVLVAPGSAAGQVVSTRPASVTLTVVVPPRASSQLTTSGDATVVGRTNSVVDVQAAVGVVNRIASRIEVRLGAGWNAESTRVLVKNRRGEFEPLVAEVATVVATTPVSSADARSLLRFRLESGRSMAPAPLTVPVEYRITVGQGDQIAVWSFPAVLQVGTER
jgi:hypothetical protein